MNMFGVLPNNKGRFTPQDVQQYQIKRLICWSKTLHREKRTRLYKTEWMIAMHPEIHRQSMQSEEMVLSRIEGRQRRTLKWKVGLTTASNTTKTLSYMYRNPHYKPMIVWQLSQVYNGNPYTNKTASFQWIEAWVMPTIAAVEQSLEETGTE